MLLPGAHRQATRDAPARQSPEAALPRACCPAFVDRPDVAVGVLLIALRARRALAASGSARTFCPNFQETDFLMHLVEKPGTSLEAMERITIRASKELRAIPGVRNFGSHIGRAEVADEVVGPNFTELWISIDPDVDYDATRRRIQTVVDGYPGLYRDVLTYLRERIKEVLTGASATVVVRLYGPDLDVAAGQGRRRSSRRCQASRASPISRWNRRSLVPQVADAPPARRRGAIRPDAGQVRRAATTLIAGRQGRRNLPRTRRSSTWWSGARPARPHRSCGAARGC